MSTQQKILVTGAGGSLGSALLQHLNAQGYFVRVLLLPGSVVPALANEACFGDVRDARAVKAAVHGMDTVLHMAGLILTTKIPEFFAVNTVGTRNVIHACQALGVRRLLFVSSISVEYSPRTSYAESKFLAEQMVQESGLDWTIIRPTLLVGQGGGAEFKMFARLAKLRFVPLPAGGAALKRPVHVSDLAEGIAQILQKPSATKTYAMAGAESYTLSEMLLALAQEQGYPAPKILSIPSWIAKCIAWGFDLLPGKYSRSQALAGLLQNANPSCDDAMRDFGYAPKPLKGRWFL